MVSVRKSLLAIPLVTAYCACLLTYLCSYLYIYIHTHVHAYMQGSQPRSHDSECVDEFRQVLGVPLPVIEAAGICLRGFSWNHYHDDSGGLAHKIGVCTNTKGDRVNDVQCAHSMLFVDFISALHNMCSRG